MSGAHAGQSPTPWFTIILRSPQSPLPRAEQTRMSTMPPSADPLAVDLPPAVEGFLQTVLSSGLLDRDQLQAALNAVPKERRDNPQILAEHFIKGGKLSRFQAEKLLKG